MEVRIGLVGAGWMGKAHTVAYRNVPLVFGPEPAVSGALVGDREAKSSTSPSLSGGGLPRATRTLCDQIDAAAQVHLKTAANTVFQTRFPL